MLRNPADRRTITYLAAAVGVSIWQWTHSGPGQYITWLYPVAILLAISTAVISHNHNHGGLFHSKWANLVTSWVISVYYGHPAIGWVPTHNAIHHKLNNKEGDSSRSPKFFKSNHLFALLVYPTLTGIVQMADIRAYFARLWVKNRRRFWSGASEYVVFFGVMAALFILDWRKALLYFLIPQQVSLFVIQIFNYVQHVEADENSAWNHSRNFESPILNALLFNNGYHTVHHEWPGVHWSKTPELHAVHAHKIDESLRQRSFWGYMVKTFFLRPVGLAAPAPIFTGTDDPEAAA